jgi:hypothetical protein
VTEGGEKPELFLPKTTAFFTGASLLLLLVFLAILVVAAMLLVDLHWALGGGAAGD